MQNPGRTGVDDALVREIVAEVEDVVGRARREILARSCAEDPALREAVEARLAEASTVLWEVSAGPLALTRTRVFGGSATASGPGRPERVGPYRLIRELGSGGMGTVYLAEQEEPVRRPVALKLIDDRPLPTRRLRFAAEAQTLAQLSHPHIATLYDVGICHSSSTSDHGRPFVAMEWIDGAPITTWCDRRELGLDERIHLFLGVCAGVRHAHQKGVLHCDLKPSNVLVAEVDGRPVAKVIDFGIARALGDRPTGDDDGPRTIAGSPAYMSPEAMALDGADDLDTRSDVYSLGLLLWNLLLGVLPQELEGKTLFTLGLERREPAPPASQRWAGLDPDRAEALAAQRGTDPAALGRRLRGDLDAILGRAIARERDDRYGSPADLAADLERHLRAEPVSARPPTLPYVAGRFARRHLGGVLAALLLLAALVGGLWARTLEARRANAEAERARRALAESREVSEFLVDVFRQADPDARPGESLDARAMLDLAAARLREDLQDQPAARGRFLHAIATVYTNLGLFEPAEASLREAIALREAALGPDHLDVAHSLEQLGIVLRRAGRPEEGVEPLRRVLAIRERARPRDPELLALAHNHLGNLWWALDRPEEAEAAHREALALRERSDADPGALAESHNNLGVALREQERWEEAAPVLEKAIALSSEALGPRHPRTVAGRLNLALVEEKLGRWDRSTELFEQTLADWREAYGPEHPRSLNALWSLAAHLRRRHRWTEAAAFAEEWAGILDRTGAPDAEKARAAAAAGRAHREAGAHEAALRHLRHALELRLRLHGERAPRTLDAATDLAVLDRLRGDPGAAETELRRILAVRLEARGPASSGIARTLRELGLAVRDAGRPGEAEELLGRALAMERALEPRDPLDVASACHDLGSLLVATGRADAGRALLEEALELRTAAFGAAHPAVTAVRDTLAAGGG